MKNENIENVENVESVVKKSNLLVEKEAYKSKRDNKEYFNYFVKGIVRGKEVKAGVVPTDKGGYQVLDLIFLDSMACELVVKPFEITNEKTGEVVTGNTYFVRSVDEDGTEYELKIKPASDSGKTLLTMLIRG